MILNFRGGLSPVLAIGLMAGGLSYASIIVPTFEPAGVQTPDQSAICAAFPTSVCILGTETFDSWIGGGFTTDFGTGNEITGTYSGDFVSDANNEFGGAGGTGAYPELMTGGSYSLSLTSNTSDVPGVNYFGLWISALDAGNLLQFYSGSTLVYSFTPADFIALVGACPSASNEFCGNPNMSNHTTNSSADSIQQFAFLNFFDIGGYFDKVVFSETISNSGFESDNHTVAYIDPPISGPEPSSLWLCAAGGIALALRLALRRAPARIG